MMNSSSRSDFCLCFLKAPKLQGLHQESADAAFTDTALVVQGMRGGKRSHAGESCWRTTSYVGIYAFNGRLITYIDVDLGLGMWKSQAVGWVVCGSSYL